MSSIYLVTFFHERQNQKQNNYQITHDKNKNKNRTITTKLHQQNNNNNNNNNNTYIYHHLLSLFPITIFLPICTFHIASSPFTALQSSLTTQYYLFTLPSSLPFLPALPPSPAAATDPTQKGPRWERVALRS